MTLVPPVLFPVRLGPDGPVFQAGADRPVLASAEAAGVALESSCRNGSCRTCMRRLLQGSVAYRIPWPGLLAEEKSQGWFLPCVAYPESGLVIAPRGEG